MKKRSTIFLILFALFSLAEAQTYNDGPIQLQVRVRDINTTFNATDEGVFGVGFAPDELSYKLWVRDQADLDAQGWVGGGCLQADFSPPTQSPDFNTVLFNHTYPTATVPQFFDLKLDAWEDDLPSDGLGGFCQNGTRCDYNGTECCGFFLFGTCIGINESDDYRCNADPFKTGMDYRLGPPCQWYNHGYVIGSGCSDNYYQPRMESYWRYTRGTGCNDAIALGSITPGFSAISHYNSNECYTNNFASSGGNDVFYEFTVSAGVGVKISLCANATFNTVLYLLDPSCNVIASNDDFCAATSEINTAVCTPGTYKIVVDGASAAEMGTFTLTLSENPSVIVNADAGSNLNTCPGIGANIGGSPAAFGGVPGYTYDWSPGQYLTDSTIANPVANVPGTTTFYLTVTDAANCSKTDSVTVTVLPGPTVDLGNDTTICATANLVLDAGAGNSFYFWSNGAVVPTIPVSDAGTYFVTVIDNFGCQGRDTVTVNSFPDLSPALPPTVSLCDTPGVVLDAGPGYTSYTWNGTPGGQTFPVTASGNYALTVTDANNCSYSLSTAVTLNPLPTPNLGADQTLCPGEEATLNPGAGYVNYLWNTGAIDQLITVDQPGVYSVAVTDVNGCPGTDQMTLANFPVSNVDLGPDIAICDNGSATLTAQNGFVSYFWSTGSTLNPIQVTASALYWVFATDNFGCVYSDTVSVSVSPQIGITQTGVGNVSCFGESDGFAAVSVTGGTAPLTYSWDNGADTPGLQNVPGGVFTLTVTDANNCSGQLQVIIDEPAQIAALLDVVNNTCEQTNAGSIEVEIVGGVPPYDVLWNTGQTGNAITGLEPGSYFAVITDASGCQATDTAEVITLNINVANDQIVVPNIFTPNNDNVNDVFSITFNISGYESYEFSIRNRWGNTVYTSTDPNAAWDGGKHPDGTYFYTLRTVLNCGDKSDLIERGGTVTITR